jgi:acetyl-CoA synthetase
MNLSGIKVSSAEIERVVIGLDGIREAAAIAVPVQGGGPNKLIVYVVGEPDADLTNVKEALSEEIRAHLNPLFKVHTVIPIEALPRTASNKVMRRQLRDHYLAG